MRESIAETRKLRPTVRRLGPRSSAGFSVVELLVVMVIIGVVSAIALVNYMDTLSKARRARAVAELRSIEKVLARYEMDNARMATGRDQIEWAHVDPWDAEYVYELIDGGTPSSVRTDGSGDALNTDYDLYSKGPDALTAVPITDATSTDDIVRAENGAFVGLASDYEE